MVSWVDRFGMRATRRLAAGAPVAAEEQVNQRNQCFAV